ncbi:MAG: hypothetical protein FWH00_02560 [Oscillospiraceae bacterium]|nr:hypothetical protein [Oscillospiraceae bacterium]
MKKNLMALIAITVILCLAACSGGAAAQPEASNPAAEKVSGITVPAFSVSVNGIEITQEAVAAYPVYSVQATTVNSSGTESTAIYIGYTVKDILDAAGLSEDYIWLEASADDGYTITLTGETILQDTTLLAVMKDDQPFAAAPWLAPCNDKKSGNYLKNTVSILVSTTEPAAG